MNLPLTRNQLWGELTRLRMDVELRKIAGEQSEALRQDEMRALQIALELKATCEARIQ